MFKLTWRNLLARKVRLVMSALAIVLAVHLDEVVRARRDAARRSPQLLFAHAPESLSALGTRATGHVPDPTLTSVTDGSG